MLKGHSKGLALLFLTEMWERFSFYGLQILLPLYLVATIAAGGHGWTKGEANYLVGVYGACAYLTPLLGGYLSDRYLGQRKSTMIGAVLMAAGHFLMAVNAMPAFYSALALVAFGNGFFKPCMTSILGQLYDDRDESDRDSAYSIFYMGINLGSVFGIYLCGWLANNYGYDYGFSCAGVGMLIALYIFWWGKDRYLEDKGINPSAKVVDHHEEPLSSEQKSRLLVAGFMFLATVIFMMAYQQIFGLVTLYINDKVDRMVMGWEIPTAWLAGVDPLMIVLIAPTLALLWNFLGDRELDPFFGVKMGVACFLVSASFWVLTWMSQQTMPSWIWIIANKLLLVLGELCFLPISWAAVTRLSPKATISRVMALMLAGIGVASYLGGYVSSFVDYYGEEALFYGYAVSTGLLGVLFLIVNPKLKKMCHGLH